MELSTFENGIQEHFNVMQKAVLRDGLYVSHESGYSYTVGMTNIGASELILFGESSEVAEELFMVIFQSVKRGLVNLDQAMAIDSIFEPGPRIEEFSNRHQYFFAARTYYGSWDFKVLKVSMDPH